MRRNQLSQPTLNRFLFPAHIPDISCGTRKSTRPTYLCRSRTPVCGSDGRTYQNICVLEAAKRLHQPLATAHKGPCFMIQSAEVLERARLSKRDHRTKHETHCNLTFLPVCGTNGQTYRNRCFLKYDMSKKPWLRLEHRGWCRSYSESEDTVVYVDRSDSKQNTQQAEAYYIIV